METEIIVTIGSKVGKEDNAYYHDLVKQGIKWLRFNIARCKNAFEMEEMATQICWIKARFAGEFSIILDLPIPRRKVRVHNKNISELSKGQRYFLVSRKNYSDSELFIDYNSFGEVVAPGNQILYGDGEARLLVEDVISKDVVSCVALDGSLFKSGKAVHFGKLVNNTIDDSMLQILHQIQPDKIALSFIESGQEVADFCAEVDIGENKIIAKIETLSGIENMEEIADKCDIMIGRGDLQHYGKFSDLYLHETEGARVAEKKGKKLYIATGILKNLEHKPFPTAAEVVDLGVMAMLKPFGIILNSDTAYNNLAKAVSTINEVYEMCSEKDA